MELAVAWTLLTRNVVLSVALAAAMPAFAQSVIQSAPLQAPVAPSETGATRPPLARQILPMVEPVRRSKPGTVAVAPMPPKPAAPIATRSPVTPTIAPPLVSAASNVAAPVPPPKAPAAAAPTVNPAVAANIKATPAARPKFVAYTCRVGQDFSLERQACVPAANQRPAAIATTARKVARAKPPKAPFDATDRSALGAKPKSK